MHFFYANITTYCLHISGNAMEGQCDVALLSPGTWDDTGCISPADCSSLAYTDGATFVVGDNDGDACPDITSGSATLFDYELETITLKCVDNSSPVDGYLE